METREKLTLFPLREYCSILAGLDLLAAPLPEGLALERTVELVSYDSQNVRPGTLFLCKGAHFKPEYLAQAAQKGAFAYVSETPYRHRPPGRPVLQRPLPPPERHRRHRHQGQVVHGLLPQIHPGRVPGPPGLLLRGHLLHRHRRRGGEI